MRVACRASEAACLSNDDQLVKTLFRERRLKLVVKREVFMSAMQGWLRLLAISTAAYVTALPPAIATDRTARSPRTVVSTELNDSLQVAMQPRKYAGTTVRLACDHLRDADLYLVVCNSGSISFFIETRNVDDDVLRFLVKNCQGRLSHCSGLVSGRIDYVRGLPRISDAKVSLDAE